ncbi:MAG: beta-propeller fold lactonase family protein [Acidobacteriota bacterium]
MSIPSLTLRPSFRCLAAAAGALFFNLPATLPAANVQELTAEYRGSRVEVPGAESVAESADGRFLYVAAETGVHVFERDAVTGKLAQLETHWGHVFPTQGQIRPDWITLSADGRNVYVATCGSNSLVVFARDEATGRLAFVEAHRDNVNGVDGLDDASMVTVSPDGAHVYVAGAGEDEIAVFARDATTGAVTFIAVVIAAAGDGLGGVRALGLSSDGRFLYAGGAADQALAIFERDAASGLLTFLESEYEDVGGVDGLGNVWGIVLSADGLYVHAVSRAEDTLLVWQRNGVDGTLTYVETQYNNFNDVENMLEPWGVAVSPDGGGVYVTSMRPGGTHALVAFDRDPGNGTLTFLESHVQGQGALGLQGAHGVLVTADSRHVYVASAGSEKVAAFARDEVLGTLTFVSGQFTQVNGLDGVRAVAVSAAGEEVYAVSGDESTLAVFARDAADGTLTPMAVEMDGVGGVAGLAAAAAVAVSPDDRHVVVAGTDVAVFRRDAAGGLSWIESQPGGGRTIAFSPGGEQVYVGGGALGSLTVFDRDATTGVLSFVDEILPAGPILGFEDTRQVSVSPDGQQLYAAAAALVRFDRDPATGELTWVDSFQDLEAAGSVVLGAEGIDLYAAHLEADAVGQWERDATTGVLSLIASAVEGVAGVSGLAAASHLALSPDRTLLHVVSQGNFGTHQDDAIALFRRDLGTGALGFIESQNLADDALLSLRDVSSLAVSPDGRHLYVTSPDEDALSVFRVETDLFIDGFESGDTTAWDS